MKYKSIAVLSFVTAVCMLGGCTEKAEQTSVNVADMGEMSAEDNASTVSLSQAVSTSVPKNSSNSGSSKNGSHINQPASTPIMEKPVSSSTSNAANSSHSSAISSGLSDPSMSSTLSSSEKPSVPVVPDIGLNNYKAMNYSEVKGIWISYIELAGLPSDSESSFRSSIGGVYDNCAALGINTVFVHVRSHSDAYYSSDYFPRTKYLGGSYDPLPIMIDEAHKRGLSFQAWINPMRGCSAGDIEREKGYPIYDWAGGETRLVELNGCYYLNPAYDEAIELIAKGAAEIAAKYDVDGLHIDDYFYPTTETWFDDEAYQASSYSSLSEFRLANCDKLVSSLYSAVKSANSTAIFGVSPQGNYQNNYVYMYADVEKWCTQSGYLDYIMPQIYFGFKNAAQPFTEVLKEWDNIAAKGRIPLIVGLSPSKIGTEDGWGGIDGRYEWINDQDILKRQFIESSEAMSYGGICLYSYNSIFSADVGKKEQVDREIAALKTAMN